MGSWADDRIQGGDGKDQLDGLAGNDILEGGDGDDKISADGIVKVGYLNSVAASSHGADFVDGGEGKDNLNGGGKDDRLFGGAGDRYRPYATNSIAAWHVLQGLEADLATNLDAKVNRL